ncbi:MAG: RNB domain-containing ribonuclease [Burkholderiales bacterium]
MFVFYEEDGAFKLGTVVADNTATLQVDTQHGKRAKIKAANVLLRFNAPALTEFAAQTQKLAEEIDTDFLWQCCGENDFGFEELAKDYYGHTPSAVESAAVATRVHAAPMYFYKKGKGRYKAAPEESLKSALASVEKKRLQVEQQSRYVEQLCVHQLPPEFINIINELLYKPDRNTLEVKALEAACAQTHMSAAQLLTLCGGLRSHADFHLNKFLFEYFPLGVALPALTAPAHSYELPLADVRAFSIDDASTTEIDDAFSLTTLPDGNLRIGIHIAAPALGVLPDTPIDAIALYRLSTVYFPDDKITMLPESAIAQYSLHQGREHPVLSMYVDVNAIDYQVMASFTRAERVLVVANVRIDALERAFSEDTLAQGLGEFDFKAEIVQLHNFALALEAARGKSNNGGDRVDYNFDIVDDRINITPRRRGSPVDKLVSELMIFVNSSWGKLLADNQFAAIYRAQSGGKTRMTDQPAPHQGLGVEQYIWASSPLRRYVDLINQRQLLALLSNEAPVYARRDERLLNAMRQFDITYDAYADFQRNMERYWCLRYLEQENIREAHATVLRENLVRFDTLPLVAKVADLPALAPGASVRVAIQSINFWDVDLRCTTIVQNIAVA